MRNTNLQPLITTTNVHLKKQGFSLTPRNLEEATQYAKLIADSDFCPREHRGKPGNILIAVQYGAELGLSPMQAIQNISIINGKPCIWGDAMLGLVKAHHSFVNITEEVKDGVATCMVERRNQGIVKWTFSREDAKRAGLLGKAGPWTNYESRMLQMRARGFALRDAFPDVLKGLTTREEVEDYEVLPNSKYKAASINVVNAQEPVKQEPIKQLEQFSEDDEPVDWQFLIESALNVEDLKKIYIDIKSRKNMLDIDEYKRLIALIETTKLSFININKAGEVSDETV